MPWKNHSLGTGHADDARRVAYLGDLSGGQLLFAGNEESLKRVVCVFSICKFGRQESMQLVPKAWIRDGMVV